MAFELPKKAKAKFRHVPLGAKGMVSMWEALWCSIWEHYGFYSAQRYLCCSSCSALPYRSVARINDV